MLWIHFGSDVKVTLLAFNLFLCSPRGSAPAPPGHVEAHAELVFALPDLVWLLTRSQPAGPCARPTAWGDICISPSPWGPQLAGKLWHCPVQKSPRDKCCAGEPEVPPWAAGTKGCASSCRCSCLSPERGLQLIKSTLHEKRVQPVLKNLCA